jgi:hypothetical protein
VAVFVLLFQLLYLLLVWQSCHNPPDIAKRIETDKEDIARFIV